VSAAEAKPRALGSSASPKRILIVDDNAELRRGFCRMLRNAGHQLTEAINGAEAAAFAKAQRFDLVVSDVHMPDMSGVELLKLIHESDPDVPVLLISGEPDLDSALKAVEYGATEYLAKPVQLDKFRTSVARALELGEQREQAKLALQAQSGTRPRSLLDPEADLEGALLGERYRVGALLGSGGMGSVYEAVRDDAGRAPVALKVLHPSLASDTDALRRFKREAYTVANLDHPNIVRILDFQNPPEEPAFLVMERLHGGTLGDALRQGRRFSVEEVARIAVQVLAALEAAHAAQVVHRDLKPDNVFLATSDGQAEVAKLLDFGVAKLIDNPLDEKLTQTGMVMGTPAYMAPEQARGAAADARSDIYAVGCLVFEALSGQPPFSADNYNALLYEIQASPPPSLQMLRPDVDAILVSLVEKAMSRDMEARFQSAQEMSDGIALWALSHVKLLARRRSTSRPPQ